MTKGLHKNRGIFKKVMCRPEKNICSFIFYFALLGNGAVDSAQLSLKQ